jgi:hypothetical protein
MNKNNARTAIFASLFIPAIFLGCLQSKPKTLGKTKPSVGRADTADSNSFKFNFAFRDTTAVAPLDKIIYIQGSANSKTAITSTCNSAGTNCVCVFTDTGGVTEETDVVTNEISYDQTGNYLRCEYDGVLANLSTVKVRNQNSTVTSETLSVDTSITVQKLIGSELDVNLVRSIYRYVCLHNFLEKDGTSTTNFDCSSQASLCSDGVGALSGDFCLLQSNFPYYVFADNYSTNLSQKPADLLYNQGNDNSLCGLQIKKYDCAGGAGTPVRQFGLFAQQAGIFDTAVQLSVGPDISAVTYGFAAKTSTFMGNTVCPPGMERRIFKQATTSTAGMMSTNYPNGEIIKDITDPTAALGSVAVVELQGGDCNGSVCTPIPSEVHTSPPAAFAYSIPVANVEFCVIKESILP